VICQKNEKEGDSARVANRRKKKKVLVISFREKQGAKKWTRETRGGIARLKRAGHMQVGGPTIKYYERRQPQNGVSWKRRENSSGEKKGGDKSLILEKRRGD